MITDFSLHTADTLDTTAALPRRRDAVSRVIAAGVAALVALSLLASGSTPARADADSDRILKAIVGVGALAIIANELGNKNDHKRDRYDDWRDDRYGNGYYDNRNPPRRDDRFQPSWAGRIPSSCAIEIDAGRGRSGTVYAESCLKRSGVRQAMPRGCGHDIRVEGRRDRVFSEQCLRDAGFRTRR